MQMIGRVKADPDELPRQNVCYYYCYYCCYCCLLLFL